MITAMLPPRLRMIDTHKRFGSTRALGGVSLDVDRSGTLYVVWPGTNGQVYLDISRDQGHTWKGPFAVSPPGVITSL